MARMRRVLTIAGAALVAAALVLLFFYVQAPPATPVGAGDMAPDFEAPGLPGEASGHVGAMRGSPALLVFFDGRWPNTVTTLREIERLHREHFKRGLRAMGVLLDDVDSPKVPDTGDLALTFHVVHDRGGRISSAKWGRPDGVMVYLLSPSGRVEAVFGEDAHWRTEVHRRVDALLPPEKPSATASPH
jgi:peroxiredoxin